MLAPHPDKRHIDIAGPRFRHDGAWGHLLNAHYLIDIDKAQRYGSPTPPGQAGAAPYVLIDGTAAPATVPHLFRYLDGANPA
jgi:hypothetical protein